MSYVQKTRQRNIILHVSEKHIKRSTFFLRRGTNTLSVFRAKKTRQPNITLQVNEKTCQPYIFLYGEEKNNLSVFPFLSCKKKNVKRTYFFTAMKNKSIVHIFLRQPRKLVSLSLH